MLVDIADQRMYAHKSHHRAASSKKVRGLIAGTEEAHRQDGGDKGETRGDPGDRDDRPSAEG